MINFSDLMTTIIGAFIGGLFSIWVVRLQLKSREKEREAKQASKIAAWLTGVSNSNDQSKNCFIRYNLIINNSSNLPIYNVLVLALSNKRYLHFQNIKYWDYNLINYYPFLAPGEKIDSIKTYGSGFSEYPMVSILFTDTNMRHWYRNQMGKLTQLNAQEYDKLVKNLSYRPPL
ncbi:hypothetical protein [Streptococcus macacae]|uniref:Uncharacterized protein n=1 Tax=Streptococcus macacae NCTC 11558 TaxID=764298 RepID=G5JWM5_9STRE|nr:hypothetical protein [Streptococcus macacae]EHJ53311.1 hypothetical protein STRMA_0997 [Streptococcus macacae NCTC 11558]SUN78817.1 Uncharacterised protein [Streptococcus macacae NCTC 11558]